MDREEKLPSKNERTLQNEHTCQNEKKKQKNLTSRDLNLQRKKVTIKECFLNV